MTDVEKQKQMEQIKQSEDGMRQTVLLIKIGLMVFLTFACCTVFFFLVLRYKGVADTWHLITGALQPIIIGLGLAYLLNPVMKFQERHWLPFLKKKMKSEKSAAKVARGLSIAGGNPVSSGDSGTFDCGNCSFGGIKCYRAGGSTAW